MDRNALVLDNSARAHPLLAGLREHRLVQAAKRGRIDAVEELVRRHWDGAYKAAYLIIGDAGLAEDAAQEALLAAVERLDSFDIRRPVGPWLHRIAVNKAIDIARSAARQPKGAELDQTVEFDARWKEIDDGGSLQSALQSLSDSDRAIVVLRYVLAYKATEIAEWLGLPASTVRARLHRARIQTREHIEEKS